MIAIRGMGSNIAKSLIDILSHSESVFDIQRDTQPPLHAERYFMCQGLLYGKQRIYQTEKEISDTYRVNFVQVASMCDFILERNPMARICVIGSESGIVGSHDEVYADSKRLLHHYVETKHTTGSQQFVCIAPSIIGDAGMTLGRVDVDNLERIRKNHPKHRFLSSVEVARTVKFLLYEDLGYTTGVVIRMNGGKHCSLAQ